MVLEITHANHYFKIKGNLNKKNLHIFQSTFQNIFDSLDSLIISIEGLDGIDREGVNAIAKLHNESLIKNKKLSIVGVGCKDLYNHFSASDAA
jgi:anti-anti-sigma regulatory factor